MKEVLLHISEISFERTVCVSAVYSEFDEVTVKLIFFDRCKMMLSVKALEEK